MRLTARFSTRNVLTAHEAIRAYLVLYGSAKTQLSEACQSHVAALRVIDPEGSLRSLLACLRRSQRTARGASCLHNVRNDRLSCRRLIVEMVEKEGAFGISTGPRGGPQDLGRKYARSGFRTCHDLLNFW
jgi:hypothetical protein